MSRRHLFERLPDGIFTPLSSRFRFNYWRILEDLHEIMFDLMDEGDEEGYSRSVVIETIQSTVDSLNGQFDELYTKDDDNSNDTELNEIGSLTLSSDKANYFYRYLVESGWLQEEKKGFHYYVTMPQYANLLISTLSEIIEGRPLIASGELKTFRDAIDSIATDPFSNADSLIALTSNVKRFSNHLKGIRSSIKFLYDQITHESNPTEKIRDFFDIFLKEIFVEYVSIKTEDHPLKIRDHLLETVGELKNNPAIYDQLLAGYKKIKEDTAAINLEKDLTTLERVFDRADSQLYAIDRMFSKYMQRLDHVISYAKRQPRKTSSLIKRCIHGIRNENSPINDVLVPFTGFEEVCESRIKPPITPRKSPEPQLVQTTDDDVITPEMKADEVARRVRQMAAVNDESMINILKRTLGNNVTASLKDFKINSISDYFHAITLIRLAQVSEFSDSDIIKEEYPMLASQYRLIPTNDYIKTDYIETTQVVIERYK